MLSGALKRKIGTMSVVGRIVNAVYILIWMFGPGLMEICYGIGKSELVLESGIGFLFDIVQYLDLTDTEVLCSSPGLISFNAFSINLTKERRYKTGIDNERRG